MSGPETARDCPRCNATGCAWGCGGPACDSCEGTYINCDQEPCYLCDGVGWLPVLELGKSSDEFIAGESR